MEDPDETPAEPKSFAEIFAEALKKVPPEDYDRVRRETLEEMHAEAMIGVGTRIYFPPEVLERITAYEKEHAIDRDKLIPEAMKATKDGTGEVVELANQLLEDPDSFEWPIEDPLLCVSIAFLRACANWLTRKISQEYGDDDDGDEGEDDDWWKDEESE